MRSDPGNKNKDRQREDDFEDEFLINDPDADTNDFNDEFEIAPDEDFVDDYYGEEDNDYSELNFD